MPSAAVACTVYFDGACPLCSREIQHYQRQAGAEQIDWVDASKCDVAALGEGLARGDALARLHVRASDGRLVSGAAAFASIWAQLPAYAWLARLAARRPVVQAMEWAYSGFLRLRRLWRPLPQQRALPVSVLRELRTDHAGEAGAVQIYRGILAVSQDPVVRQFALCHLRTELQHLRCIRRWVPRSERSRLLRLWRMAGWLTGALPAVLGPRAVFATVAAVERFVDQHYSAQISALAGQPALAPLRATLENFRRDEVAHRDEALAHLSSAPGLALRLWATVVGRGSAAAVAISRRW